MADEQDDSQKTEEPSQKRLEEARKRGQIYNSREINSFLILFTFALLIGWSSGGLMKDAAIHLTPFIERPDTLPADQGGLGDVLRTSLLDMLGVIAVPMLAFLVAALAAGFIQKPLILSGEPLMPKWEKVSPIKGLKRLFSTRSLSEFVKGLIKITIVAIVCFMVIWPERGQFLRLPDTEMPAFLHYLRDLVTDLLIGVLVVMFLIAMLDYLYQRYEYIKGLRMSKQELKDEYKQQEGDPLVKQKIRALRMERARKRMMAEVPTSDVVITNPTHYAVALRYDSQTMEAPMLVAKGQDKVALRIREVAKEHDVPVVENPPLARALFPVPLEQPIPIEHYKAVAEVISYVYKLKRKTIRPRTAK